MPDSGVAAAAYVLVAETPLLTPYGGAFLDEQHVTMTTSTPGATIRYTLNGTEPTASSTAYTAPVVVDVSLTLKAAAFKTGIEPSVAASHTYTLNVRRPGFLPSPGKYSTAQSVTLTAAPGSAVHYTIDGSEPTTSSPLYSSPFSVSATTTVKARAFRAGWSSSAIVIAEYTIDIDATNPTITAKIFPSPNAAGWNNTPVTVSFECADDFNDTLTCSPPVTVLTEGTGQVVTGTVTDGSGHTASASVTLKIDRTPGTITLSTPADETSTAGTSIAATATASDALSGVDAVWCNGQPATIVGGSVSCTAPLPRGRTPLILQLEDVAGNRSSAGIHVTRTGAANSMTIAPKQLQLLVGQQRMLQVKDDYGRDVTDITWSSSDATIADFDPIEPSLLTAIAAGTVTVTVTAGSVTAEATVTVAVGTAFAPGSIRWVMPQLANGYSWIPYVHARKVDINGPDIFVFESTDDASYVRGLTADGVEVSRDAVPSSMSLAGGFGDAFGGVVVQMHNYSCFGEDAVSCDTLVRMGGGAVGAWQYRVRGELWSVVQDSQGNIYLIERFRGTTDDPFSNHLVRIDGASGAVQSTYPIPRTLFKTVHCEYDSTIDSPGTVVDMVVDKDDTVHVLLSSYTGHTNYDYDADGNVCLLFDSAMNSRLDLLTITAAGSSTMQTLATNTSFSNDGFPIRLTPLPGGGALASGGTNSWLISGGSATAISVPEAWPVMIGVDGTVFTSQPSAFDSLTGTTYWQGASGGQFGFAALSAEYGLAALANRGALYSDGGGVGIEAYDGSGSATTLVLPLYQPRYWGDGRFHGTTMDGTFAEAVGEWVGDRTFYQQGGGAVGAGRVEDCPCVPTSKPALTGPVVFYITPNTFTAPQITMFQGALDEWKAEIHRYNTNVSFSVTTVEPAPGTLSVYVSIDQGLNAEGEADRDPGTQWTIKFNPLQFLGDGPLYLRRMMLHEIGHIIGLSEVGCQRTQAVMGTNRLADGVFRGAVSKITKADKCGVQLRYQPTP